MSHMGIIDWEEFPRETALFSGSQKMSLCNHFACSTIHDTGVSYQLSELKGFLQSFTNQKLKIILNLKIKMHRPEFIGKPLLEALLVKLPEVSADNKKLILDSVLYIISKHDKSKELLLKNIHIIKVYANVDEPIIKNLAQRILGILEINPPIPRVDKVFFPHGETFQKHLKLLDIFSSAKSDIKIHDNYCLDELTRYFLYLSTSIGSISILTKARTNKAYKKFINSLDYYKKENSNKNIIIKKHTIQEADKELLKIHIRMIIIDNNTVYNIGNSLDNRAQKSDSIIEFDKNDSLNAIDEFQKRWDTASVV